MKEPAEAPRQLKGKPLGVSIAAGDLPTLAQLGLRPVTQLPGQTHMKGGAGCCCCVYACQQAYVPYKGIVDRAAVTSLEVHAVSRSCQCWQRFAQGSANLVRLA